MMTEKRTYTRSEKRRRLEADAAAARCGKRLIVEELSLVCLRCGWLQAACPQQQQRTVSWRSGPSRSPCAQSVLSYLFDLRSAWALRRVLRRVLRHASPLLQLLRPRTRL